MISFRAADGQGEGGFPSPLFCEKSLKSCSFLQKAKRRPVCRAVQFACNGFMANQLFQDAVAANFLAFRLLFL